MCHKIQQIDIKQVCKLECNCNCTKAIISTVYMMQSILTQCNRFGFGWDIQELIYSIMAPINIYDFGWYIFE